MNWRQLVLAFTFISPLSVHAAYLAVYDQPTCEAGSYATWDPSTSTCTLTGDFTGLVKLGSYYGDITFDGAGHTIYLTGTEDVTLEGSYKNTLKNVNITGNSSSGLLLYNVSDATVSNVNVSGSFYYGMELWYVNNVSIKNSSVSGASNAIALYHSSNNRIENNTLTGIGSGSIGILNGNNGTGSANNVVTGNTISNFDRGIVESPWTAGNTYYRNNFIDNTRPIYGPSSVTYSLPPPEGGNYYNSYDEEGDGCFDIEPDGFCDNSYALGFSAFDDHPWTTQDGWVDAKGAVTVTGGGIVSSDDGSIVIDVAEDSIVIDTTIYAYVDETPVPDVMIGDGVDSGIALATYEFGPDGTEFDPAALLTLVIDVTALSETERDAISIYRHEDTDGDGDIDTDDGFNEILGANCLVSEDPIGTFIATCTANIDHFSIYSIILVSNDSDGDGISDGEDLCPNTLIPENVPTVRLGTNRWALTDVDGIFDTTNPRGRGPERSYTIEDTGGCSCEQIIDELDLGKGHSKFGCSISAMDDWTAIVPE